MAIKIGSIGYNYVHENNFVMDLPQGPGAYLFLLIKSSAFIRINNKKFNVVKNTYIILSPATPSLYKADKDKYIDDWFYFSLEPEDKEKLIKMGIKFDEPQYIHSVDALSDEIHHISFELFSSSLHHSELQQAYTDIFFYKLSRLINSAESVSPQMFASKNEKLVYVRSRLYNSPNYFNNVDEMADFMNLSRSGFQHLYSKTFGVNIIQDVIKGRIKIAKELLQSTNLTISEIAQKCGYKTEYHFMRQFKEQTSFTPTEFRNSNTWIQLEESR